jgi:nucleoside-diphosphate-sugar epimerase
MARVLFTGSEGFIGKKIVEHLKGDGHEVVPYDIGLGQDILDLAQFEDAVKNVDVVYHIAAQADLTKITDIERGKWNTDINVTGTHNAAYLCAKYNKLLVYASTCCVYGNQHDDSHKHTEDRILPNPSELYAASKLAGENIIIGYGHTFGLKYVILRFATIYGPGMRDALAVHVFFDQALNNEDITIHGDGEQDRTQTYVEDLAKGAVAVMSHPESINHVINLTAEERVSVNKMAEDIKKVSGSKSNIIHTEDRPNQTRKENLSAQKARDLLGWEAETSWEEGLAKTYHWMLEKRGR